MADVITKAKPHDPNAKLYYSVDFADWLRTGDSLSACTVTVVDGVALVDTAPSGSGSTSASATISGTTATIAVVNAASGKVGLQWRVTSSDGEADDRTTYLTVEPR